MRKGISAREGTSSACAGSLVLSYLVSYGLDRSFFYRPDTLTFSPSAGCTLAGIGTPASRVFIVESASVLGRELIRPSTLSLVNNGQPLLLRRQIAGAIYVYADGHAKWQRMPPSWDPKPPGRIPSSAWSSVPAVATTQPTAQYQQWFPWSDGEETW